MGNRSRAQGAPAAAVSPSPARAHDDNSRIWEDSLIRIIIEGDYHCGDVLGLGHPDHWPKRKRRLAELVWNWRTARLKEIGRVDIHVLGGDLVHGLPGRGDTLGILEGDLEQQIGMAVEAVECVKADNRCFAWGTPRHTADGNIRLESFVAKEFSCTPTDEVALGPLHGVRMLDRHVVGRSDIPYGQGTPIWKEWVREQLRSVMEEFDAADVHVRHHVHYFFEVRNSRGRAVTCPAWELPRPPKGWAAAPYPLTLRTQYYDIGFLMIEIDKGGEVFIRPQIMPLKVTCPREYMCPQIRANA